MRHLPCVFLATGLLYGGQSLVTSTAVGNVNYPSTAPYTNVSDVRVEIRLTDLSTCKSVSSGYGNNLLRLNGLNLGCTQLNTKSLAMENGGLPAPIIATNTQLGAVTDVILRLQKLTASGMFVAEVWSTSTRALLATRTFPSGLATRKGSIAGSQLLLPGTAGTGTTNIAWVRVYNTTVPAGLAAPRDETSCDMWSDCMARWEFEGNLAGTGFGGTTINLALANPVYTTTPAYLLSEAPVVGGKEPWRRGPFGRFASYLAYTQVHKLGQAQSDASTAFLASRLWASINGRNPAIFNDSFPASVRYIDAIMVYNFDMPVLRDIANAQGFHYEDMILHMNVDHSYNLAPSGTGGQGAGWFGMDQFDKLDPYGGGVYLYDGGFTDVTAASWNSTGVTITSSRNQLYLGYSEPFDEVRFTLKTPRTGGSITWEYWNGTQWAPTVPAADSTQTLTRSGVLRFRPPANWARLSLLTGQRSKWWIRMKVVSASVWPVIGRVTGDDLTTGQLNSSGYPTFRGWCATDADNSRINKGLTGERRALEYDPNPPSNCQARFRWQARMPGIWAGNMAVLNIANVQNGIQTASKYIVENSRRFFGSCSTSADKQDCGWKGIYLDDMFTLNTKNVVSPPARNECSASPNCPAQLLSGYTDLGSGDWMSVHMLNHYKKTGEYLRMSNPGFRISGNIASWSVAAFGDLALIELGNATIPGVMDMRVDNMRMTWDQFKTTNQGKPSGYPLTTAIYAVNDSQSELEGATAWAAFDRGNRGPMTAMALYFIHANENTAMFYNTSLPSWYAGRDDFTYWNTAPDAYIRNRPADRTAGTVKMISGDFSSFPATSNAPVAITSIVDGTVTLSAPLPGGIANGIWVFIEGTTSSTHNGWVKVTSLMSNSVFRTALTGSSSGGTAKRQSPSERVRIGELGEYLDVWKIDNATLATAERINNSYRDGTGIWRLYTAHQSTSSLPPVNRIYYWGLWFPALGIDVGQPAASGFNSGHRRGVATGGVANAGELPWISAAASSTWFGIIRRDFTNSVMLVAPGWYLTEPNYGQLSTYSNVIRFDDPSYQFPQPVLYPLRADGVTDNSVCNYGPGADFRTSTGGCTAIRLRTAEGTVLMKYPVLAN